MSVGCRACRRAPRARQACIDLGATLAGLRARFAAPAARPAAGAAPPSPSPSSPPDLRIRVHHFDAKRLHDRLALGVGVGRHHGRRRDDAARRKAAGQGFRHLACPDEADPFVEGGHGVVMGGWRVRKRERVGRSRHSRGVRAPRASLGAACGRQAVVSETRRSICAPGASRSLILPSKMPRFRALFTRDVRKKREVYHDGFVLQEGGRPPALTDEAGAVLARAERAVAPLAPDAEGVDAFLDDGFLVDLDGLDGEEDAPEPVVVAVAAPPPRRRAPLAAPSFTAPRLRASPGGPADAPAAPSRPPIGRRPRSDAEILGLLSGAPAPPPGLPAIAPRRREAGPTAQHAPWKSPIRAAAAPLAP